MDYINQPIGYKLRKVLRYTRLYGIRRTWIKVQGQRHAARHLDPLPATPRETGAGNVGIIGCGNFAYTNIAYYLHRSFGRVIRLNDFIALGRRLVAVFVDHLQCNVFDQFLFDAFMRTTR